MSKVIESEYTYKVCPHCSSKRVVPRVVKSPDDTSTGRDATGFLCSNCDRYHLMYEVKYKVDRAEIKRDIKKLQRILDA